MALDRSIAKLVYMRTRPIAPLIVVAALAVAAALVLGAVASGAFSGRNGRIVFAEETAKPFRPFDIYAISSNRTALTRITRTAGAHEMDPATSPGGRLIAYTHRGLDGPFEIWVMHRDGTHQRRLAAGTEPAWAPDGKLIAYVGPRQPRVSKPDVWVMHADGSHRTRLTFNRNSDRSPAWSPDGKLIAFVSDRVALGNADIWTMDSHGHNLHNVTSTSRSIDDYPAWSPDGHRILFISNGSHELGDLFTMNADGSDRQRVGDLTGTRPTWSPDGKSIAFTSPAGLWVADANGAHARLLVRQLGQTHVTAVEGPDWR